MPLVAPRLEFEQLVLLPTVGSRAHPRFSRLALADLISGLLLLLLGPSVPQA
jgi:hypothetical protein